jgi:hypothetical protein
MSVRSMRPSPAHRQAPRRDDARSMEALRWRAMLPGPVQTPRPPRHEGREPVTAPEATPSARQGGRNGVSAGGGGQHVGGRTRVGEMDKTRVAVGGRKEGKEARRPNLDSRQPERSRSFGRNFWPVRRPCLQSSRGLPQLVAPGLPSSRWPNESCWWARPRLAWGLLTGL